MTDQDDRWAAVADAINGRLSELAWHQADLVRESGVSAFTVRRLMQGSHQNYREANLGRIARALWGDPGAIRRLVEGGPAGPAPEASDVRAAVEAALAADPGLSDESRRFLIGMYDRERQRSKP